ncbi:hypothetical protein B0H13DRAFT_1856028 [Mycena leptocephala]|nr:hypothetical protein B0H13DRAFT_1856028 [Mycena leptocephala]
MQSPIRPSGSSLLWGRQLLPPYPVGQRSLGFYVVLIENKGILASLAVWSKHMEAKHLQTRQFTLLRYGSEVLPSKRERVAQRLEQSLLENSSCPRQLYIGHILLPKTWGNRWCLRILTIQKYGGCAVFEPKLVKTVTHNNMNQYWRDPTPGKPTRALVRKYPGNLYPYTKNKRFDFEGSETHDYGPNDFGYIESDNEETPMSGSDRSDESESDDEDDLDVEERADLAASEDAPMPEPDTDNIPPAREIRMAAEDRFHHKPIVVKYPGNTAGKPISTTRNPTSEKAYESPLKDCTSSNPYAPLTSKMDWEVAKWAKLRGAGSTAFSDLLNIEGIHESLNLSYGNSVQLNQIIDQKLPGRPKFVRSEVIVNGEAFHLYSHDILECVRAPWGDSEFAPYLFVAPERHYIDKTRPSVFGNKTAYPVYMTVGNIPKEIRRKPSRRGYVLLGYLPTSKMKNIKNKSAQRRILANVFHACMMFILAPLKVPGVYGMPVTSGDGVTRRGHPIYATFVGDYPEQCLVCGTKTGECCTCEVPRDNLGEETKFPLRNLENILAALDTLDEGPAIYTKACAEAGIKPIYPHSGRDFLIPTSSARSVPISSISYTRGLSSTLFLDQGSLQLLPLSHYIKLFGTTDNYNTEYTERLHIDLAKDAYRSTNFKDEFPQMTLWLERKEKIFRHEKYIQWRLDGCPAPPTVEPLPPGIVYEGVLK